VAVKLRLNVEVRPDGNRWRAYVKRQQGGGDLWQSCATYRCPAEAWDAIDALRNKAGRSDEVEPSTEPMSREEELELERRSNQTLKKICDERGLNWRSLLGGGLPA
jgi:hypothetical protein